MLLSIIEASVAAEVCPVNGSKALDALSTCDTDEGMPFSVALVKPFTARLKVAEFSVPWLMISLRSRPIRPPTFSDHLGARS